MPLIKSFIITTTISLNTYIFSRVIEDLLLLFREVGDPFFIYFYMLTDGVFERRDDDVANVAADEAAKRQDGEFQ